MTHMQIITIVMFTAVLAFVGLWDLWALYRYGPEGTVSEVIYNLSCRFPLLPLLVGVLLGHLFWPQGKP